MTAPHAPLTLDWPLRSLPVVHYASRYALDDQNFSNNHLSSECHVLHLYDYQCAFRLGENLISVRPGDVSITPLGIPTSYDLPHPGYHWCIHFYPSCEQSPKPQIAKLPTHMSLGIGLEFAIERMTLISRLHAQAPRDPIAEAAASATLLELLLWLGIHRIDTLSSRLDKTHSDRAVIKVAELIDQQIDQPLSVPKLARQVALSQNYLAKCFRQHFGITITRYLLCRRVELAKQLLRCTEMPIGSIAQRVGLADSHYFNKQFRRITGSSPSAWRNM